MKLGIAIIGLALGWIQAQAGDLPQLYFPIEKSRIQILPQRFEYQLLNKDQIQIGNVLVDATKIDFQILPSPKSTDRFKLRFHWPAGLLNQGEIAIKDNSGKGLWFEKIKPDQVTLSEDRTLASFETETDIPALVKSLQLYPFFRFCVHREEPRTKTFLCSKDLYIRRGRGKGIDQIEIVQRDSFRPLSYVEINGQAVDKQGLIYLNSPSEFISLRALLLSGATLEVDTRMKEVNFKDVYMTPDEKQLVIRAEGTEPVDPQTVEHPLPGEWQTQLEVDRPSIYIKGEGDLPLRQEFLIKGKVRKQDTQVEITSGHQEFTLKGQSLLTLKPSQGLRLEPADKNTSLGLSKSGEYRWLLTGLQKNERNRRYIKVRSGSDDFIAAYDLPRFAAFDATLRVMAPLWTQAHLLFTPSAKWGFSAQYDSQFAQSVSSDPVIKSFTVGAQYRHSKGAHLQSSALVAEAYIQPFFLDSTNFYLYGLGIQAELENHLLWSQYFEWTYLKLRSPLISSKSDWPVKSSYEAEVFLKSFLNPTLYWELGLRSHKYLFESSSGDLETNKAMILIGFGKAF